jgi:hypothetical protein
MTRSSAILFFRRAALALAALSCALAAATAQEAEPPARRFTLLNGTRVVFSPQVEPGDAAGRLSSRVQLSDLNAINRVLLDEARGVYFGYTVRVEPIAHSNKFRVTFTPLRQEEARRLTNSPDIRRLDKTLVASRSTLGEKKNEGGAEEADEGPRYPAPQVIEDGDTIALDVLVNPTTGAKLADRITVSSRDAAQSDKAGGARRARDFSLGDVELKVSEYQVLANGKQLTAKAAPSGVAGPLVWIYIPGRGRFAFSISPRPEHKFEQTGVVEENKILFSYKGEQFEWRSKEPILSVAGGGSFNLYVRHDPHFKPKIGRRASPAGDGLLPEADEDCCLVGAADSLEALLQNSPGGQPARDKKDE